MVVVLVEERSLPNSRIRGSNPAIRNFNYFEKTKIKKKRPVKGLNVYGYLCKVVKFVEL